MKLAQLMVATCTCLGMLSVGNSTSTEPTFTRLHELNPKEGVFAYSRISPNGQALAYASERFDPASKKTERIVKIIDLKRNAIVFTEPGIDAYWSYEGDRVMFLSLKDGQQSVSIVHPGSGHIDRDVAPKELGDYYSWGLKDKKSLILTILGNYYFLERGRAALPAAKVTTCPSIGPSERPLLSKDGKRISAFASGFIVVRNLSDCRDIIETGIRGAKADFSWDGRYIAFHVPKARSRGYEIQIVDTQRLTVRTLDGLSGSALFPSWTSDGRLSFRYDDATYRGFLMASNVLSAPEKPLPRRPSSDSSQDRRWEAVVAGEGSPAHQIYLLLVWSTWSAHSSDALIDLQKAANLLVKGGSDIGVATSVDSGSDPKDVARIRLESGVSLKEVVLTTNGLEVSGASNQMPAVLLFVNGVAVDRKLGAQTADSLIEWVKGTAAHAIEASRPDAAFARH